MLAGPSRWPGPTTATCTHSQCAKVSTASVSRQTTTTAVNLCTATQLPPREQPWAPVPPEPNPHWCICRCIAVPAAVTRAAATPCQPHVHCCPASLSSGCPANSSSSQPYTMPAASLEPATPDSSSTCAVHVHWLASCPGHAVTWSSPNHCSVSPVPHTHCHCIQHIRAKKSAAIRTLHLEG